MNHAHLSPGRLLCRLVDYLEVHLHTSRCVPREFIPEVSEECIVFWIRPVLKPRCRNNLREAVALIPIHGTVSEFRIRQNTVFAMRIALLGYRLVKDRPRLNAQSCQSLRKVYSSIRDANHIVSRPGRCIFASRHLSAYSESPSGRLRPAE
ncbi:hypothetical protein BJ165DRAFT_1448621 [Panaeolus papilionaceus]|nr:hypothetical protein BJ165DRAFT_1448621 [Panaeolus papilionaceus]